MNLDKFTDRAKGFLQSAQTVAIRMNHQRITPLHLLKALLEDEEGMAAGLIQRAGGDAPQAVSAVDIALSKIPAVTGSGAQSTPGMDNDLVRVLDASEGLAEKAGDTYVTVERVLTALAAQPDVTAKAMKAA
ncbi:MAG: Clp protease N-terminal domain-containing protein, partial [Pseudomonadota bacterium]